MTSEISILFKFDLGDAVTHLLNPFGASMFLILDRSYTEGAGGITKQYRCRVMSERTFTTGWFHEHELRPKTPMSPEG